MVGAKYPMIKYVQSVFKKCLSLSNLCPRNEMLKHSYVEAYIHILIYLAVCLDGSCSNAHQLEKVSI